MKILSIIFFRIFLLFVLCNLVIVSSNAQSEEDIFNSSVNYYKSRNYEQAVNEFEKLTRSGIESTALFYNLGNSYYRLGKIGNAIVNYERALKLSPGDEDVVHNLAFVNLKTIDKIESLPKFFLFQWWENLLSMFTLNGWSYFVLGILFFILVCIVVYFFTTRIEVQKASFIAGLVLSFFLIFNIIILLVNLNRELNWKFGIVMTTSLNVKTSPDNQSKDSFIIHEGSKVKIEDNLEKWYKLKLEDGKVGWANKNDIEII